jgi:hypothetical protein
MGKKSQEPGEKMETVESTEANKSMIHSTIHRRFTMKRLIIAVMFAAMAAFATDARADDITANGVSFTGDTAPISAIHTDFDSFTDTFNLITTPAFSFADINLNLPGILGSTFTFTSATLNGESLVPGVVGVFSLSNFANPLVPLQLVVLGTPITGFTGWTNPPSGYNGTLTLTAVPEPASLMLLGAGLAAIGIWRRKAAKV